MVLAAADLRNAAQLRELTDAGERPKYLLFWGHRPAAGGGVGKGCLSQWRPAPFTADGVVCPTAEDFMMAGKAMLFGDSEVAQQVVTGNLAKFSQHPQLAQFLLATGERVLVEASPRDRVWGIGLAADDERVASPHTWQGLNLPGFALMEVRDRLRAPAAHTSPPG